MMLCRGENEHLSIHVSETIMSSRYKACANFLVAQPEPLIRVTDYKFELMKDLYYFIKISIIYLNQLYN